MINDHWSLFSQLEISNVLALKIFAGKFLLVISGDEGIYKASIFRLLIQAAPEFLIEDFFDGDPLTKKFGFEDNIDIIQIDSYRMILIGAGTHFLIITFKKILEEKSSEWSLDKDSKEVEAPGVIQDVHGTGRAYNAVKINNRIIAPCRGGVGTRVINASNGQTIPGVSGYFHQWIISDGLKEYPVQVYAVCKYQSNMAGLGGPAGIVLGSLGSGKIYVQGSIRTITESFPEKNIIFKIFEGPGIDLDNKYGQPYSIRRKIFNSPGTNNFILGDGKTYKLGTCKQIFKTSDFFRVEWVDKQIGDYIFPASGWGFYHCNIDEKFAPTWEDKYMMSCYYGGQLIQSSMPQMIIVEPENFEEELPDWVLNPDEYTEMHSAVAGVFKVLACKKIELYGKLLYYKITLDKEYSEDEDICVSFLYNDPGGPIFWGYAVNPDPCYTLAEAFPNKDFISRLTSVGSYPPQTFASGALINVLPDPQAEEDGIVTIKWEGTLIELRDEDDELICYEINLPEGFRNLCGFMVKGRRGNVIWWAYAGTFLSYVTNSYGYFPWSDEFGKLYRDFDAYTPLPVQISGKGNLNFDTLDSGPNGPFRTGTNGQKYMDLTGTIVGPAPAFNIITNIINSEIFDTQGQFYTTFASAGGGNKVLIYRDARIENPAITNVSKVDSKTIRATVQHVYTGEKYNLRVQNVSNLAETQTIFIDSKTIRGV